MNNIFISRWPVDLAAVNVDGSIIDFMEDGSVTFSNEMLSPGAIICSWYSKPKQLFGRFNATLPVLKPNETYHLTLNLIADREESTQVQLIFYDADDQEIGRKNLDQSGNFVYPRGSRNFQINLLNIRHHWIHFSDLQITTITDENTGVMVFGEHWVIMQGYLTQQLRSSDTLEVVISFEHAQGGYGILSDESALYAVTDGQNLTGLIDNLKAIKAEIAPRHFRLIAGKNFYGLADNAREYLKTSLMEDGDV